jgi:nucleotide-binding universal stress UspA family protein
MMKTIVVPVDFSPASLNAANYALDLATAVKASLALIHVHKFPLPFSEIPVAPASITALMDDAEKNLQKLKTDLAHKAGREIKIYTAVREGTLITQLEQYCQSVQPYMVVMGTHSTSAIERILFGSHTLSAMRNLLWPLIIVPVGSRFTSIGRIGLACDLQNVTQRVHANEIKKLVKEFRAQLHILHITKEKHGMASEEEIEGSEWLREMLEEAKPVFHFIQNVNIEEAIYEFSEKNNLDMLIIIPQNHGLPDRLLHKSHTKQMVLHTHIPVLSLHE